MSEIRDEDCEAWLQHGSEPGWRARHKPTGITIHASPWAQTNAGDMIASLKRTVARELAQRAETEERARHFAAAYAVGLAIYKLWPTPKKPKPRYVLQPKNYLQAHIAVAEGIRAMFAGEASP